jgi:hypothetical protein
MELDKEAKLGTSITMIAGRGLIGEGAYEILLGEGVATHPAPSRAPRHVAHQ